MTDAAPSASRAPPSDCVSTTPHSDHGRAIRGDATAHVAALLGSFRLLEAAGACELIAATGIEPQGTAKPPSWWKAVADAARTYRPAIHNVIRQGFSAVDDWSQSGASTDRELRQERARLRAEHREWLCAVPGGGAYVAWLGAYLATVELDGQRALTSLERCTAIAQEYLEVPSLGPDASIYAVLQGAADALVLFLPLAEHPIRDMRRFAFLPASLQTGYGS